MIFIVSKESGVVANRAEEQKPMKMHKVPVVATVLASVLFMLQVPPRVTAQNGPPPQGDQQLQAEHEGQRQDPPGRVARLSYSTGSISFQPGGEGDWVQAVNNRPLTSGDNLWADRDSRAELQVGSTSIRMDSETSLTFLDLDDRTTQLRLSQGSIILRVNHLDDDDNFEVDTPNLAFQIVRTGEYRLTVNADGNETDTTVWRGRAEVTGGGQSFVVVAGQRARFSGSDQLDHEIDQIGQRDDFDQWSGSRDQRDDRSDSSNYISAEMTGANDLDEYGHWRYVADYGPVWSPSGVPNDWAPYRFGHWVWVSPWGWTWVEDEPWGFAPFHYGRWAFVESSWCWVPGPVMVRPVYAPALVAFVGGGGFAVGVGVGPAVAWFPLAPREVFVPWYRTSPTYVNQVNVTNTRVNVTQVTNVYNTTVINNNTTVNNTNVTRITYANQRLPNAVTAVSHETFVNARPVARNIARVDPKQIAEAQVSHTVPVQPTRASVMGAGGAARAKPPATVVNRQVVAIHQPAPPRASFEQRQAPANVRTVTPSPQPQPVGRATNEAPRPGQPAVRENEAPRSPQPSARGNEAPQPAPRPNEAPRPGQNQAPQSARQPEPGRPQPEPGRPQPQAQPQERAVPHPPVAENGHPLVRQAPPVQERPEQQRSEQQKFNNWQQQRQSPPPREAPRPAESHAPPPHAPQPAQRPAPSHPDKQH